MLKKFCIFSFLIFISLHLYSEDKIDPLSQIIVHSKSLKIIKDEKESKVIKIQYKDNVKVDLADGTKLNSNFLEIIFDNSKKEKLINESDVKNVPNEAKNIEEKQSPIKKIYLEGNVVLNSKNRTIKADSAEFHDNMKVYLKGNVEIEQIKEKNNDLPINIKSNEVEIDLEKEEVDILGTEEKSVSTVIDLRGYNKLLKPIKTKKQKEKMRREAKKAKRLVNK